MDKLSKITTNGKAIYLAYDHGLEHGPIDLKGKSIDPKYILDLAVQGGYNAIVYRREWLKSITRLIGKKFL